MTELRSRPLLTRAKSSARLARSAQTGEHFFHTVQHFSSSSDRGLMSSVRSLRSGFAPASRGE
jgi:hypothetical protein